MKISDLLVKERINLNVQSTDKINVIRELAKLHDSTGVLSDYEGYVGALNEREAQSSTALEDGIAIPHAKTEYVKKPALAIGRSSGGIDYGSIDGELSTLFFMIAAPADSNNAHIETLARLTQLLLDDDFKKSLDNAKTPEEVLNIINEKEAERLASEEGEKEGVSAVSEKSSPSEASNVSGKEPYIIAATACPTGIAHTYMAAESLKKAAKELGVKIKVETNGTDGRKNELTAEDISAATGVILAIDRNIETGRFNGKQLIKVGAREGINNAKGLIQQILDGKGPIFTASGSSEDKGAKSEKTGLYKHLMSGVSYMLPLVISGGILIALAFLADTLKGVNPDEVQEAYGSTSYLANLLMTIGTTAFKLFIPILGGYIAFSIGERAAITAGLVAGALASAGGSGFLGALAGGFLAGYVVKFLVSALKGMPKSLAGLKMILLYPVLSVLITGAVMVLGLNPVIKIINDGLNGWLMSMSDSSAVILGLVLGGMMAVDMGGPVNKAAYVFGTGTLASTVTSGGSSAMAAVMAGGMVPPIAIALATTLFKNKFTKEEREAGLTNYVMGLSFITEGAIPYAAADPGRVIPASVVGSAIAGALTMLFDIKIRAPHGGILVMLLSNNFIMYFAAVAVGSVISAVLLGMLKPKITSETASETVG